MRVTGIGRKSVQGDTKFADVLEKMGARITRATISSNAAAVNCAVSTWT